MFNKKDNTFTGKDGLKDYLNPLHVETPLVELPEELNPFYKQKIRIFAKLLNTLPLNNVKSIPAYHMLEQAQKHKKLKNVKTLVENSSGNTVFSLSVLAHHFGVQNTKAIVSYEVKEGKLKMLQFAGIHVHIHEEPICPDPNDKESGIYKAKKMGKKKGWLNPSQFDNVDNPKAHEKITGPQIWKQTKGLISIFCAGIGTSGTLVGTGQYLTKKNKNIKIIAVARSPNNPVPGVRTATLAKSSAFPWMKIAHHLEEVSTKESFLKSLALCRLGLMVGPSSGFNLCGLLNFLKKNKKKLETYRNEKGEVHCVFICCDTPYPYLDEYFEFLEEKNFPSIENKELLDKENLLKENHMKNISPHFDIEAQDAYQKLYSDEPNILWNKIERQDAAEIKLKAGMLLLDVRQQYEYDDVHLPGSMLISHEELLHDILSFLPLLKGKEVIAICRSGVRSRLITEALREKGIDCTNLKGGIIEWSQCHLPRVRFKGCNRLPH